MHEWVRNKKCDISEYLPKSLDKNKEFQRINRTDSDEHERIRLFILFLLNQLFLMSPNHDKTQTWILDIWEDVFALTENKDKSYNVRLNEILIKMNSNEVSTKEFMTKLVNRFVVDKSGIITELSSSDAIFIEFNDGMITDFEKLIEAVETFIPAHIGFTLNTKVKPDNPGQLHFGGIITARSRTHIEADTGFDIIVTDSAKSYVAGIVTMATHTHIEADINR